MPISSHSLGLKNADILILIISVSSVSWNISWNKEILPLIYYLVTQFSSVQFSHSVVSNSLWPRGLQYTRPPCPLPTPGVYSNSFHRVGDAIQPSHPLLSPFPPVFNLSQHQGLFQWVSSSYHVAKVLELQLQHQSFQWIFRTDFL